MSGMQVSNFHGVKIYNLSSGKTLPQWLSEKKRRSLSKDVEYRRRIELLQDFDFPTASQRVQVSADGQYVIVTGTYPPQVKVFAVADLAMKFERHLDCDAVDFLPLAEGYEKIAFLLADRTLEFHAGYGRHHTVRIPRFGRSLAYQQESCDMLVGGGGGEIHRFNLDLGRFRTPITLPSTRSCNGNPSAGINKIDLCVAHQLLAAGTDDGFLHLWDARQGQPGGGSGVAHLDLRDAVGAAAVSAADQTLDGFQVSAVAFDTDGLTLGVGTSSAHCLMFDLRSPRPSMVKEHQYGLPVTKVTFHQGPEKRVLSADRKTVKIWSRDDGAVLTNVETPADINDVCVAHDSRGDSGLLLMAAEQPRVLSYYVPALGPAPRWSSFLDGLTEELDEEGQASVYEDYKFVTSAEVEELGVSNLVGSALLRGYMHGYFMDMKLYARLKAVSEPFAYDEYRKKRLKQKIQEKQKSRIAIRSNLPKVNRAMAERLLQDKEGEGDKKRKRNKKGALGVQKDDDRDKDGMTNASLSAENPLGDDRFAAMFESEAFEVDPESEEFARTHPTSGQARKVRERVESESESEDDVIGDRFTEVTGGSETARRRSFEDGDDDVGEDEDEEEQENADEAGRTNAASDVAAKGPASTKERRAGKGKKDKTPSTGTRGAAPVPVLYELNEGEDAASTAVGLGGDRDREAQRQKRRMRSKPLGERVQDAEKGDGTIVSERVIRTNAGVVREFSYTPASGGGRRGRGTRGGGGGRGRGRGRRR